jgi:hypothetical protein
MKTCTKCHKFYDWESWQLLPCDGVQHGIGDTYDQRTCPCGGSMYLPLFPFEADAFEDFLGTEAA